MIGRRRVGLVVQVAAQLILGEADDGIGVDDVLLGRRDADLGLYDVDRGERAHVDLDLRDAVQLQGDVPGLDLHLEVRARVYEVPVGLLDRVDDGLDAAHEGLVRRIPAVARDPDVDLGREAAKVPQEGLREAERQGRGQGRVHVRERVVRQQARTAQSESDAAAPGRQLVQADVRIPVVVLQDFGAGEIRRGRLVRVRSQHVGRQQRIVDPHVLKEEELRRFRSVDRNVQVLVVGEGDPDRLFERQRKAFGPRRRNGQRLALTGLGVHDGAGRLRGKRGGRRDEEARGRGRTRSPEPQRALHAMTPYVTPIYASGRRMFR